MMLMETVTTVRAAPTIPIHITTSSTSRVRHKTDKKMKSSMITLTPVPTSANVPGAVADLRRGRKAKVGYNRLRSVTSSCHFCYPSNRTESPARCCKHCKTVYGTTHFTSMFNHDSTSIWPISFHTDTHLILTFYRLFFWVQKFYKKMTLDSNPVGWRSKPESDGSILFREFACKKTELSLFIAVCLVLRNV